MRVTGTISGEVTIIMAKERIKPLLTIAAANDPVALREAAQKTLKEIQDDIGLLNKDKAFIRNLLARYGGAEDNLDSKGRTAKVLEAGRALARNGQVTISAQDVIDYLEETQGLRLSVGKPASVAGTILASAKSEFERLEAGKFKFIGSQSAGVSVGADES